MTKQKQANAGADTPQGGRVEGEGSYTSTRRYNEHLKKTLETKDTEELAEQARRALEGNEREELEEAERRAKGGPKPLSAEQSKR